jgi:nucleotide sugar dehydrogenase
MRISIAGAGFVGSAIGRVFELFDNQVTYLDVDRSKIDNLKSLGKEAYMMGDPIAPLGDITFICVPTPTVNGQQDTSYVTSACETIAMMAMSRIIVVKSTVLPGTMRSMIFPLVTKTIGRKDIRLYSNPEFLTEANGIYDFLHNKVVIGTNYSLYEKDDWGINKLLELYKPFKVPKITTGWEEAEIIKYASNVALANRISYWDEIYKICTDLQIDPLIVSETVCLDKRIGTYGIRPIGKGYSGTCLPKDSKAFISWLKEKNIISKEMEMLEPMDNLNEYFRSKKK